MSVFQMSLNLSQHHWFKVGDKDDCWVVVSILAVLLTTPWNFLVSTTRFREAADDPDDGVKDGGNNREIVKGIVGCYPEYKGKLRRLDGVTKVDFRKIVNEGRAVVIALMPGKLPPALQYGINNVPHECIVFKDGGRYYFGNPWNQKAYARFDEINSLAVIMPALEAYGGLNQIYGVAFPTTLEMLPTHPEYAATLPDTIAAARAEGYISGWNESAEVQANIAATAAGKIRANTK